jgi:hypothetical protein
VGRYGTVAGDSHYGGVARDLRSYGILAADWALAERLMYDPSALEVCLSGLK